MRADIIQQQIANLLLVYPELAEDDVPYLLARFFSKVSLQPKGKQLCWVWNGSQDEKGYGLFRITPNTTMRAHRVSFLLFRGTLSEGRLACHSCDTPPCVNPSHLFPGSHQDNIDDCVSKGRRANLSGPRHGNAKLDYVDVMDIRDQYASGKKQRQLAKTFGVSQYCIWSIVNNITWTSEVAV